ncbi:MAG: prepilin peptidase, partial [Pseudomonadales bacterium]|nr:prepilin peptidase [Pseudomonadales bacterium]
MESDLANAFTLTYDPFYGQKRDQKRSAIESRLRNAVHHVRDRAMRRRSRLSRFITSVDRFESTDAGLDDDAIIRELHVEARRDGITDQYLARAFALVRRTAERELGLRHFDEQLIGGWAMMKGMVAEMETGQGKTLTATLAVCAAALAGFPTHVITVNEYLAQRDAEWMGPVYKALGLSVGVVLNDMSPAEKRAGYRCDVAYCTNKQVAFDYLRDRIEMGMRLTERQMQLEPLYKDNPTGDVLMMRGLYFGIVDEADSILIDEAVTPLIISTVIDSDTKRQAYEEALAFAEQFDARGYEIHEDIKAVEFNNAGLDTLTEWGEGKGGIWKSPVIREELTGQALRALHLFKRDRNYLVHDGKVQIIDEFTGRLMPDRNWEGGLHQLNELKEGCDMTGDKDTLARISYQRFFRRYLNLAGMTGTGSEVSREIRTVYGMDVFRIPPAQRIRRIVRADRISLTVEEKWQAVVDRIAEVHESGQPVLIGTRSVEASELLSDMLSRRGVEHELLNARQDEREADIVADAGKLLRGGETGRAG